MRYIRINNYRRLEAFTLVEMLMVTGIIFVVSLAIYATFNNGIKIWQRVNTQLPEEDLNIFFDKFSLDAKNAFRFTGINFSCRTDKAEFPTLVNSLRLQKKTVGKIIYAYEPQNQTLNRYQMDFAAIYSEDQNATRQQSLKHVKSLRFQYYFYDTERKEYLWSDERLNEGLPLAIKLELELDNGRETKIFAKTVSIPTGG